MMAWLTLWWVWIALALALGIVEILLPSFFFLGFSLSALVVGLLLALAPGLMAGLSQAALITLFGVFSLVAWLVLRLVFRKQSSGAKTFTKDIND